MIRTSKHSIKFANLGKIKNLQEFIYESRRVMSLYLDYFWENSVEWKSTDKQKSYRMDIKNELFDHPTFWSNPEVEKLIPNFETKLSGRVRKCLLGSVLGKIGASLEKQRKRKFVIDRLKTEGKSSSKLLSKKYRQNMPVKPNLSNADIELDSLCVKIITDHECKDFNALVQLCSLSMFPKITIPIKYHRQSNKFKDQGWKIKTSILLKEDSVDLRWERESIPLKEEGIVVGADQGFKDLLTLSNGAITIKSDKHGHSLESICKKLARKKKDSKAFKRSQEHRKNFVGWNINQINFTGIKQVNLEKIFNINFRRNTSRVLKHWTNTLIRDKVKDICQKQGVLVCEQSSTYRSQRCSVCGLVKKSNRKGKEYKCKNCGNIIDADLNASLNHEIELPDISYDFRKLNLNRFGFFWKPDGVFDLTGQELTVPVYQKRA